MDKYTKFILTMIAVGILGLNYHLFKGDIISKANASGNVVHKIAICESDNPNKCVNLMDRTMSDETAYTFLTEQYGWSR